MQASPALPQQGAHELETFRTMTSNSQSSWLPNDVEQALLVGRVWRKSGDHEGPSVVLETLHGPPKRFAFGETFLIPAATGSFRLSSDGAGPIKVVKAFLKPSARIVPDYLGL